ncbi:MAG: hypothetical protein MUE60_07575 [Candidatus Eisenbacteria bacterium]|jgi:hypothetical protein|nr:hypothetical protein [Candidatus Eisenbacteria bacterium]
MNAAEAVCRSASLLALVAGLAVAASQGHSMDAIDLERLAADGTPEMVSAMADSMVREGLISAATRAALQALACNRPGLWADYGGALDSLFAAAIAGWESGELATREDSTRFFSVLLDKAYFHARAAADSLAGHAGREEAILRRVMAEAPLEQQQARAAFELGRMLRYRSPHYAAPEDCTEVARRYLESAAGVVAAGDLRARALWQLAWLEAEAGDWRCAVEYAAALGSAFAGTKWEARSTVVAAMAARRELRIVEVAEADGRLVVSGEARNLAGVLQIAVDRLDAGWVCRHARMPWSAERVPVTPAGAAQINATSPANRWEASFPMVSPGFYRLTVSDVDTVVVSTLGVVNVDLRSDGAHPDCVTNRSAATVIVYRGSGGVRGEAPSASRAVEPGGTWCGDAGAPGNHVVCSDGHAGWQGPRLAGPTWLVVSATGGATGGER